MNTRLFTTPLKRAFLFFILLLLGVPLFAQDSLNVNLAGALYHSWDTSCDIAVLGDVAYVATGNTGLSILDISDPAHPTETGSWFQQGDIRGVAVASEKVYVVDDQYGLYVLDATTPSDPVQVGSIEFLHGRAVAVEGEYAYIAGVYFLEIIDISDPASPQSVSNVNADNTDATHIAVVNRHVFITSERTGLLCYDASDPAVPVQLETYGTLGPPTNVIVQENHLLITVRVTGAHGVNGFEVMDLDDPAHPGQNQYSRYQTSSAPSSAVIRNDTIYLLHRGVVDAVPITDDYMLTMSGSCDAPSSGISLALAGDKLLAGERYGGIRVLGLSDPDQPDQLSYLDKSARWDTVVKSGDTACLLNGSGNLVVVDCTDPSAPVEASVYSHFSSDITGIWVYREHVFAATPDSLLVLDVSTPGAPMLLGSMPTAGQVADADFQGDYACLLEDSNGLHVVDVHDPTNPHEVSASPEYTFDRVAVIDGYAFVLASERFQTYYFDPPAAPSFFDDTYIPGGELTDIAVMGSTLYITRGEDGVLAFDASDPENDLIEGASFNPGAGIRLAVDGEDLYVANGELAFSIYDVSDPTDITRLGYYDTPGNTVDVAVGDGLAYVADTYQFLVLDCSASLAVDEQPEVELPSHVALSAAWPNPFNPSAHVALTLPLRSNARVSVVDILGREVALLMDTSLSPGQHIIHFDGSQQASGVYFLRVKLDGHRTLTRRLMLLK